MLRAELQPCSDDHFAPARSATKCFDYQEITSSHGVVRTAYTGRYTQADPVPVRDVRGLPVPTHPYAYGAANPLDGTDPLGLAWQKWLPNPWGCNALIEQCHKDVAKCLPAFDMCKLPYNDPMLDKVSGIGKADPAFTECFQKTQSCKDMLKKCTMATNPANKPGTGKWKGLWDAIQHWLNGDV